MSDNPFSLPPTPLITPEKALYVSRAYKALAENLTEAGIPREAGHAERQSQWWVTYSIALSQTPPPEESTQA